MTPFCRDGGAGRRFGLAYSASFVQPTAVVIFEGNSLIVVDNGTNSVSRFTSHHSCVTVLAKSYLVGILKLPGQKSIFSNSKTKIMGDVMKINKSWMYLFIPTQLEWPS